MSLLVRRIVLPTFPRAFHGRSQPIGTCPKERVHCFRLSVRIIVRTEQRTLTSLRCRGLIVKDNLRRFCVDKSFASGLVPRASLIASRSRGKPIQGNAIVGLVIG